MPEISEHLNREELQKAAAMAVALPIPVPAPVTTQTLLLLKFLSCRISISSRLISGSFVSAGLRVSSMDFLLNVWKILPMYEDHKVF